ncbi:sulfur carrier protein ThiS [Sinanaerobacter chloroacetimidivorans]|jgi:thiamine biosynthesis protein ThiS|uniref:Sulfur carrier protein ThiS n=1 Tax=Sinanaerobacter chloroacetimidivorans TaxID=2818044 RepID=A0A8J7W1C0_9FIRM|nr:sulfur carrier protein ThiS [Sinanaerobacter chloroacetimidivorans]MBR0599007.1 sulfur carrier protein ThiS [Sinanaerobacter chloroacetimidivorans]
MSAESKKKIRVTINNQETVLQEEMTILKLLEDREAKHRSAVWLNGIQLLQAEYPTRMIREGDVIKILRIVAGG